MTGHIPFRATMFHINGLAIIETSEMYKDCCDQSMQVVRLVHAVPFPSIFTRSIIIGERCTGRGGRWCWGEGKVYET